MNNLKDALQRAGIGVPDMIDGIIEEAIGPQAALLGRRGPKRPSRKSADPEERDKANSGRTRHSKSLTQIAEILHCEGFSEFCALGVLKYGQRLWGDSWFTQAHKKRDKMAIQVSSLTPEDRKIVGEFIHHTTEAAFQAGLRIGLMSSVTLLETIGRIAGPGENR